MTMNANVSTPQHPLARLSAAEATLVASIDAAAARLDAVGTSSVESALDRLRASAHAATARLADAGAVVASLVSDVMESILGAAAAIHAAMERPVETAPAAAFAGYATPEPTVEPEPAPRRTGFAVIDALLEVAAEAEGEAVAGDAGESPATASHAAPAAPALFAPDGPTLFDRDGNPEADPTEVLVGPVAVPYGPAAFAGRVPDDEVGYPVKSPQRRRKGR
jgi:hypothetical protein